MKYKIALFATITSIGLITAAFTSPVSSSDGCGVFMVGKQKVDLSKGEQTVELSSREALVTHFREGLSFSGKGECAGTYTISGLRMHITTDKEDVSYDYDYDMVVKMQSMEDFMLTRYFNDARTIRFTDVTVTSETGTSMQVPDITVRIQ